MEINILLFLYNHEANSKIGNENVVISLNIEDQAKEDKMSSGSRNGMTYEQRLKKVKRQIDGFQCSELYQTLNRLHVSPVRSPIKKTNVILKNPNFRKAEELWNFIQTYESKDVKIKDKRDYFDSGALKNEYDQAFLMTFIANKALIESSQSCDETSMIKQMMQRLINNLLDSDIELTEDRIKNLFIKQIDTTKETNIKRSEIICNSFIDRLDSENNSLNGVIDLMRNEG